jgi:hypothetical protein
MQVQVNADRDIEGYEVSVSQVRRVVEEALDRFRDRIAHVEVRLNEKDHYRTGQVERRCVLEARLEDRESVSVTHHAVTPDEAVRGAAEKMTTLIETCLAPARMKQDEL